MICIQYLSINIFDDTHTYSGNLCAAGRAFASNHTFRMKDGSGRVNPTLQLRTNAHSMFQFDSISLPSAFSSSSMEVMTLYLAMWELVWNQLCVFNSVYH